MEAAGPLYQKLGPPHPSLAGSIPSGYHDPAALQAFLSSAQTNFPQLAQVVDATALWGPGSTFEGRAIRVLKISDNVQLDEDEPNLLIVGCHHPREIVTPELCLDVINRLLNGYGSDPQITALVNNNEIWVAPCWNPDGLDYVWNVNNLWRKNRRPVGGAVGVDLNRNYPLGWNGGCGGSPTPASQTYRGPAAASENEVQTMLTFARDRRFAKVIDFHSFGQQVLLGYRCSPLPPSIDAMINARGTALASLSGWSTRIPSAEGEHPEWEISEITSFAYLLEAHTSFQPPYSTVQPEANLLWPLMLNALQAPVPLQGHITDAQSGLPLEAAISISQITWLNGESRQTEVRFGGYHMWLPAGSYTVSASATGYLPATLNATVNPGTTANLELALLPAPGSLILNLATTGAGLGDLQLGIQNIPAGTTQGYLLVSFQVGTPPGNGPLAGLWPDAWTFLALAQPAAAGSLWHWSWPVAPPLFPAQSLSLPPLSLSYPPGFSLDAVALSLDAFYQVLATSQVVRLTF